MKTLFGTEVRLWHPSALASDLENSFGQRSVVCHQEGALRQHGEGHYSRTYCVFEVLAPSTIGFGEAIIPAIAKLNDFSKRQANFAAEGGIAYVVIGIYDGDFSSFDVSVAIVTQLAASNAALLIENRTA
ncbi:MAG: hypothetical protein JNM59_06385 [Hyphomonadaceae bacterium]|nr:hypothetical protein [Hyphomonadaceae bacterium]